MTRESEDRDEGNPDPDGDGGGRVDQDDDSADHKRHEADRGSLAGIDDSPNSVPDVVTVRDRVVSTLLEFTRALERAGVGVPANASVDATRALVKVGFGDKERVRTALKATLVSRKEDIDTFERLFEMLWQQLVDDLQGATSAGADRRENVGEFAPIGADPDRRRRPPRWRTITKRANRAPNRRTGGPRRVRPTRRTTIIRFGSPGTARWDDPNEWRCPRRR